ncbi:O-Antigen ligase [Serratia rubidaea]|nr:O-antigen ligase family protein [Serratia rubidaea]QPR63030.1 O-antigen ligase family protein [Serratia rubidaea]CAI0776166.1 O-Antigen ligase [Serratia rubidaea]CAI1582398.1 O-Antigen ligase [Serratia rubidaea]HAY0636458.1 O-antigen ligase family protein [Serratia rubidaea]
MKISKSIYIKMSIYLMALRSPLIIVTMALYMLTRKEMLQRSILKLVPFILFLLAADIYSIIMGNEFGNIIGQTRDIFLAIVVAVFLLASSDISEANRTLIYRTLKYCFVYVAIAKIFIIVLSVVAGIGVNDIISWLRDTWNIQMMSLGVEDTVLARLQIPLDSAVPFFLYFVTRELIHNEDNKLKTSITFVLLMISMILTLSRAFWAETLFMVFAAILIEAKASKIFKISIITAVILSFIIIFTPVGDMLFKVIETRFGNNTNNSVSDSYREWQNRSLYNSFMEMPIFGHGIGYYIPNALRSETTKYLYESQTLSMLMSLGIIGCACLLLLIVFTCLKAVSKESNGAFTYMMPLIFLAMWLFSGSVNPLLFGASGGSILFMTAKFHTLYKRGDS